MLIKGADVVLHIKTQDGTDAFNNPIYKETTETVHNVLIGLPETEEVKSSIDLYGKRIEYILGIPKGDKHNWEDTTVEFFGNTYQTFGHTIEGIETNIPLAWHKKVRVERCG